MNATCHKNNGQVDRRTSKSADDRPDGFSEKLSGFAGACKGETYLKMRERARTPSQIKKRNASLAVSSRLLGDKPPPLFGGERSRRAVCVTCVWAGVDKVWEQKKPEARKMLLNRADSHTSGARGVGRGL